MKQMAVLEVPIQAPGLGMRHADLLPKPLITLLLALPN